MANNTVYSFATREWVAAANKLLAEMVRADGDELSEMHFILCETYRNCPADLTPTEGDTVSWTMSIEDGQGKAVMGVGDPCLARLTMDYSTGLAGARTILSTEPADIIARGEMRRQAAEAGLINVEGSIDEVPMKMRVFVARFHNELANITA